MNRFYTNPARLHRRASAPRGSPTTSGQRTPGANSASPSFLLKQTDLWVWLTPSTEWSPTTCPRRPDLLRWHPCPRTGTRPSCAEAFKSTAAANTEANVSSPTVRASCEDNSAIPNTKLKPVALSTSLDTVLTVAAVTSSTRGKTLCRLTRTLVSCVRPSALPVSRAAILPRLYTKPWASPVRLRSLRLPLISCPRSSATLPATCSPSAVTVPEISTVTRPSRQSLGRGVSADTEITPRAPARGCTWRKTWAKPTCSVFPRKTRCQTAKVTAARAAPAALSLLPSTARAGSACLFSRGCLCLTEEDFNAIPSQSVRILCVMSLNTVNFIYICIYIYIAKWDYFDTKLSCHPKPKQAWLL